LAARNASNAASVAEAKHDAELAGAQGELAAAVPSWKLSGNRLMAEHRQEAQEADGKPELCNLARQT
jgi:hypothetical protein